MAARDVAVKRLCIRRQSRPREGCGGRQGDHVAVAPQRGRDLMLFVITAFDRPGALERRLQVRPAHLAYLKGEAARIKVGGPLLSDDDQPIGSLLVIEVDDRKAAEAFADADPYRTEGVFERVEIRPWRAALGAWAS
jgi:uncharacterized protein YciI